jgi:hypothetical protein
MHGRKPAVVDYSLHGEGRAVAKLSALKDIGLSDKGGGEGERVRGFVGEQVLAILCVRSESDRLGPPACARALQPHPTPSLSPPLLRTHCR